MRFALLATALLLTGLPATAADEIHLRNGDKLSGQVLEKTDEVVILQHAFLGRLEIPRANVQEEKPDEGAFGTGLLTHWTRELELGASGKDGNTVSTTVVGGLNLAYEDDHRRWHINGHYRHARSDGNTDDHDATATLQRTWLHPGSRWFQMADGRWDWDRFQDWEHRLSGHGAQGYALLQKEGLEFAVRAGLGGTQEFGSGRDFQPEALAGALLRWTPLSGQKVELHATVYPVLHPWGEFRVLSGGRWTIRLSENKGLALRFSAEHEYRSDVDEGTDNNDLKYATTLVLDF